MCKSSQPAVKQNFAIDKSDNMRLTSLPVSMAIQGNACWHTQRMLVRLAEHEPLRSVVVCEVELWRELHFQL